MIDDEEEGIRMDRATEEVIMVVYGPELLDRSRVALCWTGWASLRGHLL